MKFYTNAKILYYYYHEKHLASYECESTAVVQFLMNNLLSEGLNGLFTAIQTRLLLCTAALNRPEM